MPSLADGASEKLDNRSRYHATLARPVAATDSARERAG